MRFLRLGLAGIWITASEFLRNQVLLITRWEDHYAKLGLDFVTRPLNGILWAAWSFLLAGVLYWLLKSLGRIRTAVLGWIIAFPMMWITLYNLQVLPLSTLFFALPLSVLEVTLAVLIIPGPKVK